MATGAGEGGDRKVSRILIVDDHPVLRKGLRCLLSGAADLEVCGEAADTGAALTEVDATHPDLVLVDISLPGASGLELIKQLAARPTPPKMLVVSMHDESLFAERALRAGAMGYVNKEEAADTIVDAIRHVLKGKVYLSQQMTERMLLQVAHSEQPQAQSPVASLSDRELEVFEHIGHGLGTREIAEQLGLSVKTIETYRENIKRKLGLDTNTELIRRAVHWLLDRE